MKKPFLFLILLVSANLSAALPPYYQGVCEMQAVLSDTRLSELLGSSERVLSLAKSEDGYIVMTKSRLLLVDIMYLSGHGIGPAHFDLRFNQPVYLAGDTPAGE